LKTSNQIVSFILSAILLASTIGLSINEHYCQDSLTVTSIGMESTNPCTCEFPMDDDCCNDVSTFYAFNGLFNQAPATVSSQPSFEVIEPISFNNKLAIANQPLNFNVYKDIPYPLAESNLYLKVQSFLL
jgi:hypothetical protein